MISWYEFLWFLSSTDKFKIERIVLYSSSNIHLNLLTSATYTVTSHNFPSFYLHSLCCPLSFFSNTLSHPVPCIIIFMELLHNARSYLCCKVLFAKYFIWNSYKEKSKNKNIPCTIRFQRSFSYPTISV
jgi:hypothetical protein